MKLDSLPHLTHGGEGVSSWSRDGKYLILDRLAAVTSWDIYWCATTGERKLNPFLVTAYSESKAQLSPDGQWMAYNSNESGRDEVYLQAFPGPGRKIQVSTNGGSLPAWIAMGNLCFSAACHTGQ